MTPTYPSVPRATPRHVSRDTWGKTQRHLSRLAAGKHDMSATCDAVMRFADDSNINARIAESYFFDTFGNATLDRLIIYVLKLTSTEIIGPFWFSSSFEVGAVNLILADREKLGISDLCSYWVSLRF